MMRQLSGSLGTHLHLSLWPELTASIPFLLSSVCITAAVALVFAERRDAAAARIIAKIIASSAFVALALDLGPTHSGYGRVILAAVVLSWLGDVFLLGSGTWFLAGIASFFAAHIAFTAAFATRSLSASRLMIGAVLMAIVASLVLPWLWPHLSSFYKAAVAAYIAALGIMVTFAFGASTSATIALPLGAIAFAASDISVARDRFIKPAFINKMWGLPLYYVAQLLIISSLRQ